MRYFHSVLTPPRGGVKTSPAAFLAPIVKINVYCRLLNLRANCKSIRNSCCVSPVTCVIYRNTGAVGGFVMNDEISFHAYVIVGGLALLVLALAMGIF